MDHLREGSDPWLWESPSRWDHGVLGKQPCFSASSCLCGGLWLLKGALLITGINIHSTWQHRSPENYLFDWKGGLCIHYRRGTHLQWFDTQRSRAWATCRWNLTFHGIVGIVGQDLYTLPVGTVHSCSLDSLPSEPHWSHWERPFQRSIFRFCSGHSKTNNLEITKPGHQSSCHRDWGSERRSNLPKVAQLRQRLECCFHGSTSPMRHCVE